jgi:ribonucleoside-diphosphate reductase alpha chain
LKEDDWEYVGEWMWENRNTYNGLSVLPYDGGTYTQAPFEDITKVKYKEMMKSLTEVDLSNVIEVEDNTNLSGELACAGGSCEIS